MRRKPEGDFVCLIGQCHRYHHPTASALNTHYKSDHFGWPEADWHLGAAPDLDRAQKLFTDMNPSPAADQARLQASSQDTAQGTSTTNESAARHICTICNTSFARKGDLDRHSKKHEAPAFFCPFFDCRFNTRGFCRRDKLASHMRQGHKVDY
jgi:hypothetical protein